ncbi:MULTISPECIES: DUF4321 domain-containing protein [Syntrophothermus]|uniref:DUF4321 domain-containing protein n=1 Tax=Syntrophothermus lipocalidus (strain DSM 12680 / TGB-C1) TaxID=643648 RepID=D7CL83_SYNLT|nr:MULTISPECIES: DUF4321 domain-containing protein [Syntrophothermus]ADI01468.1 conserved hypothetical protein [Syntrophothermus lipocalidus DSM 12680]HOV43258.1 DUF4321 domain-containing protein [Syntrophothermus lipocalidus]
MKLGKGNRAYPGWPILVLLLVLGGILGNWLGGLIVEAWPSLGFLARTQSIGVPALALDLRVFTVHFGFMFNINVFTVVGFAIAYLVFRRL